MILRLFIVFSSVVLVQNSNSPEELGELIPMTQNSLTQARFLQFRRKPIHREFAKPIAALPEARALCGSSTIGIEVASIPSGRIYAARHPKSRECIQHFSSRNPTERFEISIHGHCGVRVIKQDRWIEYRMKVVVSHALDQLTEDDKIYDVVCRYFLTTRNVASELEVLGLRALPLRSSMRLPSCSYSLHHDNPEGAKISSAKIGQTVVHKWSCPSHIFAFKVYSCTVHNGFNKSYTIIDESGCSVDERVLPNPEYDIENGVVHMTSRAFKLSSSTRIHFNCMLAVCHRADRKCMNGLPPKCPRSLRKRQLEEGLSVEERLRRIHAILNGNADAVTVSDAATDFVVIEDPPPTINVCAEKSDDWVYVLLITNLFLLSTTLLAFAHVLRNRRTIHISDKSSKHFKF